MRVRSKLLWGKIDAFGELRISKEEIAEFCRLHPGRSVAVRLDIVPKEASEATSCYYYGYLLHTVQGIFLEAGERMTKAQIDAYLRSLCPICYEEKWENGELKSRVREYEEMDQAEINEYIEYLYQYFAENYQCVLESPR